MSRSYFHRRHRKLEKSPPYWIRLTAMKPERRAIRMACHKIAQGQDSDEFDLRALKFRLLDYWL